MKLAYGVGVFDGDFKKDSYQVWRDMLKRCYCPSFQEKNRSYIGCSVDDDWKYFSNFNSWYMDNYITGWDIDKDLLYPNNRVYSKGTCVFIPRYINTFLVDRGRGEYLRGVSKVRRNLNKSFTAISSILGERRNLGYFTEEVEAHFCWLENKIKELEYIIDMYCKEPKGHLMEVEEALLKRAHYMRHCFHSKTVVVSLNNYVQEKI